MTLPTVRPRRPPPPEQTSLRVGNGAAGERGAGGEQFAAGDQDAETAADRAESRGGVWAVAVWDGVEGSGVKGDGVGWDGMLIGEKGRREGRGLRMEGKGW